MTMVLTDRRSERAGVVITMPADRQSELPITIPAGRQSKTRRGRRFFARAQSHESSGIESAGAAGTVYRALWQVDARPYEWSALAMLQHRRRDCCHFWDCLASPY
eukprot:SAG11_NODE_1249_length_5393_cov_4.349641_10_plen_105_part_00